MDQRVLNACPWVITTERRAKKEFCALFGVYPAIWIDDNPFWILQDAGDAGHVPLLDLESIAARRALD